MADDCRVIENGLKLLAEKNSRREERKLIYLTLWIHGLAEDTAKPCNEVDIINFSGTEIDTDFIKWILDLSGEELTILLAGLPTEQWLKVEIDIIYEGYNIGFSVAGFEESK